MPTDDDTARLQPLANTLVALRKDVLEGTGDPDLAGDVVRDFSHALFAGSQGAWDLYRGTTNANAQKAS